MWDQDSSSERVAKQKENLDKTSVTIKRLTREMNLSNLSASDVRIVHGAHFYADITNFRDVVENNTLRRDDFKPLHRYMHVLRLEMRHIVQNVFAGDKVQVQGPKFHGLLYKPYDDDAKLAWHALLIAVAFVQTFRKAVPQVFPDYPSLTPSIGIALGDTLVANIGVRGDRELISIGAAANYAAKILGRQNAITVTSAMWDLLSKEKQESFVEDGDNYRLGPVEISDLEESVAHAGFDWSIEDSANRMKAWVEALPLSDIESHEAEVPIDLAKLGPQHFKTCTGATVFVDIDGYTALVDSLLGDEKKLAEAVKLLHLFRYELQRVAEADFDGVAIQHQGDRLQAILHLPKDDIEKMKRKVVDLCISFNSSVEQVLNRDFVVFDPYHVSIGSALGKTVVVRSGSRGDLDASCFGDAVLDAEQLQLRTTGGSMRVSKALYAAITDEHIRSLFAFDGDTDAYLATGATWVAVEDAENAAAFAAKASVGFNTITKRVEFSTPRKPQNQSQSVLQPVKNTRNWGR